MALSSELMLDILNGYTPLFLPLLSGALLAAPASLRVWVAAQNVSALQLERSQKDRIWKHRLAVVCGVLVISALIIFGLVYFATNFEDRMPPGVEVDGYFTRVFVGLVSFISISALLFREPEVYRYSVHRNPAGVVFLRTVDEARSKRQTAASILVWVPCIMIVGAEDRGYHFAEWICSAAIIYLICSSPMSHTMSMKWLCLCISGFFAFLLLAFQPFSFSHSHRSKPTGLEASPVFMNMMWTIFPTVLLTTCYRIDFHLWRSGATSNDTLASPALEVVPSQDTIRGPIGQGIIIPPRSQMPPFPRGYFQTSLFAWLTSSFIAIKISSESNSSPPFPEFSAHPSFIALLTMFTGIGIRAWLLGELSEVLSYREEWKVPTLQAEVSLEDGDSSITKTTEMKSPEA